jgi:hypothetical protein
VDAPRLLAARSQYGYTDRLDRALHHESEAVPAEVQTELTARAQRTAAERTRQEWEVRRASIQRELDWLHSQRFQRDVRSTVRALERQLDRMDKHLRDGA